MYLRNGVALQPGDTVIDVGGNIGMFALAAAEVGVCSPTIVIWLVTLQPGDTVVDVGGNIGLFALAAAEVRAAAAALSRAGGQQLTTADAGSHKVCCGPSSWARDPLPAHLSLRHKRLKLTGLRPQWARDQLRTHS